jgi:ribosome-associated heat shock protein Hsp15
MTENLPVRIDKFLWAVRVYKTRSMAADACRRGRILIDGNPARPSKTLHGNEIITVRKPPVTYTYKVIHLIDNRVSAKLAVNNFEDLTPESEKTKLQIKQPGFPGYRRRGTGRPTKKERRVIDKWTNGFDDSGG